MKNKRPMKKFDEIWDSSLKFYKSKTNGDRFVDAVFAQLQKHKPGTVYYYKKNKLRVIMPKIFMNSNVLDDRDMEKEIGRAFARRGYLLFDICAKHGKLNVTFTKNCTIAPHKKDATGEWAMFDFTPYESSEDDGTIHVPTSPVGPLNIDDLHKLLGFVELSDLVRLIHGDIALTLHPPFNGYKGIPDIGNEMQEKYGLRWKAILIHKVLDIIPGLYKQVIETLPELKDPSNAIKTLTLYTLAHNATTVEFIKMLDTDIADDTFNSLNAQVAVHGNDLLTEADFRLKILSDDKKHALRKVYGPIPMLDTYVHLMSVDNAISTYMFKQHIEIKTRSGSGHKFIKSITDKYINNTIAVMVDAAQRVLKSSINDKVDSKDTEQHDGKGRYPKYITQITAWRDAMEFVVFIKFRTFVEDSITKLVDDPLTEYKFIPAVIPSITKKYGDNWKKVLRNMILNHIPESFIKVTNLIPELKDSSSYIKYSILCTLTSHTVLVMEFAHMMNAIGVEGSECDDLSYFDEYAYSNMEKFLEIGWDTSSLSVEQEKAVEMGFGPIPSLNGFICQMAIEIAKGDIIRMQLKEGLNPLCNKVDETSFIEMVKASIPTVKEDVVKIAVRQDEINGRKEDKE